MTKHNQKKTIMIIEDDPFIAMDLEDTFLSNGYNVLGPFADVNSSLKALKSDNPDLAMLDYDLGKETSLPVAKTLNSRNVPYVFLSGQIRDILVNTDIPEPRVVAKPFVPERLVELVDTFI